ncbi:DapH/DapD/GlmU-related protein [Flavobacterium hauense]
MGKYTILGYIHLCISLVRTKLTFRKARIIRFPLDLRGKKYIDVSEGFTTGFGCRLEAYPLNKEKVLFIGKNVQMNDYVHITAMEKVVIGNNVLMASKIYISDCSHGSYSGNEHDSAPDSIPAERKMHSKPVVIEDNVWLGEFVSVLPGVTIGQGSIVGANSVVSRDLPKNVIAVGSPAKPIKKYNFETKRWEKIVQ